MERHKAERRNCEEVSIIQLSCFQVLCVLLVISYTYSYKTRCETIKFKADLRCSIEDQDGRAIDKRAYL